MKNSSPPILDNRCGNEEEKLGFLSLHITLYLIYDWYIMTLHNLCIYRVIRKNPDGLSKIHYWRNDLLQRGPNSGNSSQIRR